MDYTKDSKLVRFGIAREHGFTLIELAVVLVVIGLLIALMMPMTRNLLDIGYSSAEVLLVNQSKIALVNYAFKNGGFPAPGVNGELPKGEFDFLTRSVRGESLYYDVNDAFTSANTLGNLSTLCNAAVSGSLVNAFPKTWDGSSYTDPTLSNPVIFVVYSTGENHKRDGENDNVIAPVDRIYENPSKAKENDYDDIVASYSQSQFCRQCMEIGFKCQAPTS
ncbi:MAG: type II secretion system GspH family protein [Gammaproteobacteria bacterium]|nr:type II secretion system GspH family protein [Gammaproteobacteria bacterium]